MATDSIDPAPDHFYMANPHECLSCGVPQHEAPTLVGWMESDYGKPIWKGGPSTFTHCYWMKQPETPSEVRQAIRVLTGQDLDCHRYRGRDPEIIAQVGSNLCDNPPRFPIVSKVLSKSSESAASNLTFLLLDNEIGIFKRIRRWLSR